METMDCRWLKRSFFHASCLEVDVRKLLADDGWWLMKQCFHLADSEFAPLCGFPMRCALPWITGASSNSLSVHRTNGSASFSKVAGELSETWGNWQHGFAPRWGEVVGFTSWHTGFRSNMVESDAAWCLHIQGSKVAKNPSDAELF